MILIGTMVGKVYVFNYNQQTIESKMLEAQRDNGVKFLSFDSEDEQYVVFATKRGLLGKNNIHDAFDSKEVESGVFDVSTADYSFGDNKIYFGTADGKIHSHIFGDPEEQM